MPTVLFDVSYLLIWGLVVLQGLVIVALLKQLRDLRDGMEAHTPSLDTRLRTGSAAPQVLARDLAAGGRVRSILTLGRRQLLLFLSADCSVCKNLARGLRHASLGDALVVLPFCHGREGRCADFLRLLEGSEHALLTTYEDDVPYLYRVLGFPTAVLVDRDGRVDGYRFPKSIDDILTIAAEDLGTARIVTVDSVIGGKEAVQ